MSTTFSTASESLVDIPGTRGRYPSESIVGIGRTTDPGPAGGKGLGRKWSETALVIAARSMQPTAVDYWWALHHWTLTEQVPCSVFVQSTKRGHQSPREAMTVTSRFITLVEAKFFRRTER